MKPVLVACAAVLVFLVAFRTEPVLTHSLSNTTVSFDREISRIIKKRCISCHSDQNLGFPLTSYEQTRPWTGSIHEEVLRRHMPPWRAVAGYGEFANDAALTSREQQFMLAWIEGNGPKSKEKIIFNFETMKTPEHERIKGDFDRWLLGKPGLLKALTPNAVAPGEGDFSRRVDIEVGGRAERLLRGLEFKPGDRRVVRAATFHVRETGQWIGSWTPWYPMMMLPSEAAFRIPAGAHIVAEIYYRSSDQPVQESGSLGLYFAEKAPSDPVDLTIAAVPQPETGSSKADTRKYAGSLTLSGDTTILAFNPEVPPGAKAFSVSARMPNGSVKALLLVRDPLVEWPTPYMLKSPVRLPKGTELVLTHHVDSAAAAALEKIGLTITAFAAAPTVAAAGSYASYRGFRFCGANPVGFARRA